MEELSSSSFYFYFVCIIFNTNEKWNIFYGLANGKGRGRHYLYNGHKQSTKHGALLSVEGAKVLRQTRKTNWKIDAPGAAATEPRDQTEKNRLSLVARDHN